jgi:hypothetical protein
MKKTIITLFIASSVLSTAFAQKEVKYSKIYYKNTSAETSGVTVYIEDAVSTDGETKLKLKIDNRTNDYIIYKPEESKFMIDGKELKTAEKWMVVAPNKSESKVLNLKGENYNKVKNYSFVLDGLYKTSLGNVSKTGDFKLPATKNDFSNGNFNCSLNKLSTEAEETSIKFNCSYSGDKIGFIFPAKATLIMPDGSEIAVTKSTSAVASLLKKTGDEPVIFLKKGDDNFTLKYGSIQLSSKGIATPDFKLPAASNDFKTGNFNCVLGDVYKKTDATTAKFKVTYTGNKIGFVNPSKVSVLMPDGKEYANAKRTGAIILPAGKDGSFTLGWDRMTGGKTMDMQFADMMIKWNDAFFEGEMSVKWNDAFVESTPEKIASQKMELEFDEATSNAKGK